MTSSNRRTVLLGSALLVVISIAAIAVQAIWRPMAPRVHVTARLAAIALDRPDLLVRAQRLASLPSDLLRVPLLHDVLREDVVDYYEHNASRLSLQGTLRRIAYEHRLDLGERLLRDALDAPAELAAWRGENGRLTRWLLVSQRNGIARLLQGLGNVALSDSQLKKAGELQVDGHAVTLYALHYAYDHDLLFATYGDRLVVLSAPGMLLDEQGRIDDQRGDWLAARLAGDTAQAAPWSHSPLGWAQSGTLEDIRGDHVLLTSAVPGFGYQHFFPGIEALRFDLDPAANGTGWQTSALLNPALLPEGWDSRGLWQALPTDAAACTSLPVAWHATGPLLTKVLGAQAAAAIQPVLQGPMAVCWYGSSRLSAPLFLTRFHAGSAPSDVRATLGRLFATKIGAYEAHATGTTDRLPVSTQQRDNATVWQRDVSARFGSALSAHSPLARQLSSKRYFPVTLAITDDTLLFSPDGHLVDDALAVLAKSYPSMADAMGPQAGQVIAQLQPAQLARLFEQEALASLPQDQEPVFRNATTQYLLPRLHALAAYPAFSLRLPAPLPTRRSWVPVHWQVDAAARGTH